MSPASTGNRTPRTQQQLDAASRVARNAPRKGGKFASPAEEPPPQTIIELIDQCYPEFNEPSWNAWRLFLKALFGLEMSDAERETFKRFTKRDTIPTTAVNEAWLVVGRRGGKSRIMALVAVYLTMCRTYKLAAGETGLFMVLAKDKRRRWCTNPV